MNLPTFDEWYEKQHGQSFDAMWMRPFTPYQEVILAFLTAGREYLNFCAAELERLS